MIFIMLFLLSLHRRTTIFTTTLLSSTFLETIATCSNPETISLLILMISMNLVLKSSKNVKSELLLSLVRLPSFPFFPLPSFPLFPSLLLFPLPSFLLSFPLPLPPPLPSPFLSSFLPSFLLFPSLPFSTFLLYCFVLFLLFMLLCLPLSIVWLSLYDLAGSQAFPCSSPLLNLSLPPSSSFPQRV